MKTLLQYPLLNAAFLVKYALLMVLAIGLVTPSVHAQTDTLPVSIQSKDRAGLQDPGMARVKTSATEFAAALSPIFNGTVSLRVDDEIMYPLNRYENQGIFAERFATRAADYDHDVAVARARPQLRSNLAGSAFILAVRQMTGDGLAMQVRFKVKLPAIEGLSEDQQTKLEGDLAAAGEKAAAGGSGGLAVAKGIDAMRVLLEELSGVDVLEDYSYLSKIVNCTVQVPPYYILPSGVLATHTGTGILTPHYFDRANDSDGFPRGSLVGFNIDSEQYISMFTRLGRGEFIGFCKSKDFEAVKASTGKDYPSLSDCKKIIYLRFSPMDAGTYNVTIPITRDGIVQTYTFSYVNRPATKIDGAMPANVIPQGMYASCDFWCATRRAVNIIQKKT